MPGAPSLASDILASVNETKGYVDTEVAAIKAKTDNLPSDPADASDIAAAFAALNAKVDTIDDFLDTEITAIKAKTDNLPTNPASGIRSIQRGSATILSSNTSVTANLGTALTDVAKAVITLLGASTDTTSDVDTMARWTDLTTTQIQFQRAGTSGNVAIAYQIVEYY